MRITITTTIDVENKLWLEAHPEFLPSVLLDKEINRLRKKG